jgi:hypothetical protein
MAEQPAEVMLMGTFHFNSPKLDAVKVDNIDVTTAESQRQLDDLAQRIVNELKPTRVLLEYDQKYDAEINARYQRYKEGAYDLPVNEIYQVGFRVAQVADLPGVASFDDRDIPWMIQPMIEYAKTHEPETLAAYEQKIADITAAMQKEQDSLSLVELLIRKNEAQEFTSNKAFYIDTNAVGAGTNFTGADAASSWWQRNFRMYALIQKAAGPGERVFVLGGSGHIAIIRDLLELDEQRHQREVLPILKLMSDG